MSAPAEGPRDVTTLLVVSLEKLEAAGEREAACRLAGEACAALRLTDPRGNRRFNALLHKLTLGKAARDG